MDWHFISLYHYVRRENTAGTFCIFLYYWKVLHITIYQIAEYLYTESTTDKDLLKFDIGVTLSGSISPGGNYTINVEIYYHGTKQIEASVNVTAAEPPSSAVRLYVWSIKHYCLSMHSFLKGMEALRNIFVMLKIDMLNRTFELSFVSL